MTQARDAASLADGGTASRVRRIGFLLVQEFTLIAFTSAVEPLRMANRLSGKRLYEWKMVSLNGEPVHASSGLIFTADLPLAEAGNLDLVLVCGGERIDQHTDRALSGGLRRLAQCGHGLGALCTGSHALARAGLLDGYRCTIHWENLASFREEFPHVVVSQELFEIDRDRYTCSGGTAPLDLMLNLIRRDHGAALATAISEEFLCERIRGRHDRQRIPLRLTLGTSQPKLMEAVALMEANLEEPMSLDELSHAVELSRRQLERLFQKYLSCAPTRYYLDLRLHKARQLLLQTGMSVVDVALACGFVSAPHFSKCYRDYYGKPPRDERRRKDAES
jgi:transcriptional regulator GlxA family with amidase domain